MGAVGGCGGVGEFALFLRDFGEDIGGGGPGEAGALGAAEDGLAVGEGGHGGGDAGEGGGIGPGGYFALRALDAVPVGEDFACGGGGDIAEDVGMTADQLGGHPFKDIGGGEFVRLLSDAGVEDNLEEDVAQLLFK